MHATADARMGLRSTAGSALPLRRRSSRRTRLDGVRSMEGVADNGMKSR